MRIGFHSPLPPARTGVAGYSAALLRALARRADVRANPAQSCDVELYHTGNNQLHHSIYHRALARPGVVVLHDAVLQHFFLGSCDEKAYVEEFVHNYGEWNRELAGRLWRDRARSAQAEEYFRYPMLRRLAENALAVVVHNPAAAALVKAHANRTPVVEIPHLFEEPGLARAADVENWRRPLGPDAFVFGVFGHLRESKRISNILRVFAGLRSQHPWVWLLVAGPMASSDLRRTVEPMLRQPGILRVDYLPEEQFWLHAAAVDVCINLRYPPAGETSGIAIRLMGIGKPVVLTAGQETVRLPETSCIRVEAGLAEEEMLAAYMLWLSHNRVAARQIGQAGRAHILRHHNLESVASRYLDLLGEYPDRNRVA
ncbi:MAG: glycosyltransferase [Acidobacteriia bacterium]|nr:glycosyltransferase [Terriglobia bacterium]